MTSCFVASTRSTTTRREKAAVNTRRRRHDRQVGRFPIPPISFRPQLHVAKIHQAPFANGAAARVHILSFPRLRTGNDDPETDEERSFLHPFARRVTTCSTGSRACDCWREHMTGASKIQWRTADVETKSEVCLTCDRTTRLPSKPTVTRAGGCMLLRAGGDQYRTSLSGTGARFVGRPYVHRTSRASYEWDQFHQAREG